ncbi:MAG: tetratricopeptide repeat protein [Actinobacteria bacterium]|nr:MAG: tetratricopeptide repeat protein [Actinomycetota bacterium]
MTKLEHLRFGGDGPADASTLISLANASREDGRPYDALGHLRQALAVYRTTGDRRGEIRALDGLGDLAVGDLNESPVPYFEQQLPVYREVGDRVGEASLLAILGEVAHSDGRWAEAAVYLQAALALCRDVGNKALESAIVEALADLAKRVR